MLRRGLAFCSFMCLATVVRAGVVIDVVPDKSCYVAGTDTTATVDIKLHQSPAGTDHYLRFTQLDFALTDAALKSRLSFPDNNLAGANPDVFGWTFTAGATNCAAGTEATCGAGHFLEVPMCSGGTSTGLYCISDAVCTPLGGTCLGKARPAVMSRTYYFADPSNLLTNTSAQVLLKGDGTPVTVARVTISLTGLAANDYPLNVIDAAQTNADLGGGDVRYGFGQDVPVLPDGPVTKLRAPTDLTGGTGTISVKATAGECGGGGGPATLQFADPLTGHSLWRTAKNVVRLRFDKVIALPVAANIQIREITGVTPTCGTFGADLDTAGAFAFSLGGICVGGLRDGKLCGANADCTQNIAGDLGVCNVDSKTLTIKETGVASVFTHRHWYEISSTGWTGVNPFGVGPAVPNVQYVVQVGDANDDGRVQNSDAGTVNGHLTCLANCGDNNRSDISGDGRVQNSDTGLVNGKVTSLNVAKPCGH